MFTYVMMVEKCECYVICFLLEVLLGKYQCIALDVSSINFNDVHVVMSRSDILNSSSLCNTMTMVQQIEPAFHDRMHW